jgi:hypothetical protein
MGRGTPYTCISIACVDDKGWLMVENVSVHHHLGTYPEYMRVSVYQLGERSSRRIIYWPKLNHLFFPAFRKLALFVPF